jgi:hypothetical protein
MEYKYLLEERVNENISFDDIVNEQGDCILNIICYHIEEQYKYPFLQFMMEKVPYCNNIVSEQLIFPYIFIRKTERNNIKELVLKKVKTSLDILDCEYDINEDSYKGIVFDSNYLTPYVLVNIPKIDICGIHFFRQTTNWFVLPSEIINNQNVLNISVDQNIINLFTNVREIGQLLNIETNNYYMLPDVVYTSDKKKDSEFKSIFGNVKTKTYNNCREYYYFYRSFYDVVKRSNDTNDINDINDTNNKNDYNYINRYALFTEGKLYLEKEKEFTLNDDIIEHSFSEPCIIICYSNKDNINPDMLVKNYESFVCLSYHILDKEQPMIY